MNAHRLIPLALLALAGSGLATEAPMETACKAPAELIAVEPVTSTIASDPAHDGPVYEVTYRYCGQTHRLIIQHRATGGVHAPAPPRTRPLIF